MQTWQKLLTFFRIAVCPWPCLDFQLCACACSCPNGGKVQNEIHIDEFNIYLFFKKKGRQLLDRGTRWNEYGMYFSLVLAYISNSSSLKPYWQIQGELYITSNKCFSWDNYSGWQHAGRGTTLWDTRQNHLKPSRISWNWFRWCNWFQRTTLLYSKLMCEPHIRRY